MRQMRTHKHERFNLPVIKRVGLLVVVAVLFGLGTTFTPKTANTADTNPFVTTRRDVNSDPSDAGDQSISGSSINMQLLSTTQGSISRSIGTSDWTWGGSNWWHTDASPGDPVEIETPNIAYWKPEGATLSISNLHEYRDWAVDVTTYPAYTKIAYPNAISTSEMAVLETDSSPQFRIDAQGQTNEQLLVNRGFSGSNTVPDNWQVSTNTWSSTGYSQLNIHHWVEYHGGSEICEYSDDLDSSVVGSPSVNGWADRAYRLSGSTYGNWRYSWLSASSCYSRSTGYATRTSGSPWTGYQYLYVNGDGKTYVNPTSGEDCSASIEFNYAVTNTHEYALSQTITKDFSKSTVHSLQVSASVQIQSDRTIDQRGHHSNDDVYHHDPASLSFSGEAWIRIVDDDNHYADTPHQAFSGTESSAWQVLSLSGDLGYFVELYKTTSAWWRFEIRFSVDVSVGGSGSGDDLGHYAEYVEDWNRAQQRVDTRVNVNPSATVKYSSDLTLGNGARTYSADLPWNNRNIDDADLPEVYFDYTVPNMDGANGNTLTGASLAFFVRNAGASEIVVWSSDYSFATIEGTSGTAHLVFTPAQRDWLRSSGGSTIRIGVGIYVSGSFRLLVDNAPSYTVGVSNVRFLVKGVPQPTDVDLRWYYEGGLDVKVVQPTNPGLHDGLGYAVRTATDLHSVSLHKFEMRHSSVNVSFSWSITMRLSLETAQRTIPVTYYTGYDQGGKDPTKVYFTGIKSVPYPGVTIIDDNYPNNAELNVTLPKYQLGASPWYWNLSRTYINTVNEYYPYQLSSAGRSDPNWDSARRSQFIGRWTTGAPAGEQVLYLEPELVSQFSQWNLRFEFDAPNEVSGAVVEISPDPGFSSTASVFLTGEDLNTRFDMVDTITYDSAYTDTFTLEVFDPLGSSFYTNVDVLSSGSVSTKSYTGAETWTVDVSQGHGPGFTSTGRFTRSINSGTFAGVYRVGFGRTAFEVNRRTSATLLINHTIWDTTDPTYNATLLNISVYWEDLADNVPISFDDGYDPLTARFTIGEWTVVDGRKRAVDVDTDGWVSSALGGTVMIGETWKEQPGVFSVYVDPYSIYEATGNMTQGFHNFTITLQRDGYQDQTITGNISIVVDTFLEVTSPVHRTGPSYENFPHYLDDGAQAEKPFTLEASVRHRYGSLPKLSTGTGKFYEGKINIDYTLIKIGHQNPNQDDSYGELYWNYGTNSYMPEANWSLVNTTFITSGVPGHPEYNTNYHNGSLAPIDEYGFNFGCNITAPRYEFNAHGFGDIADATLGNPITDEGVEKVLYYNLSYWVETNLTLEVAPDGSVHNSFQPNIIGSVHPGRKDGQPINGSCERPKGFGAGTPPGIGDDDYNGKWDTEGSLEGRKREEWVRVWLHKEETGNVTILRLYNASWVRYYEGNNLVTYDPGWYRTNASDSGWAFNASGSVFDIRDPFLGETPLGFRNPKPAIYSGSQYWKNLTVYSDMVEVSNKNPQLIRFRVIYNCTWSEQAAKLNPGMPEPMWSDDQPVGGNNINPRCGPLAATQQYEFDTEPATVTLYNWNGSAIPLTPDPAHKFVWRVRNFTEWKQNPGNPNPPYIPVVGDTWVTPWLNVTEHAAVKMDGQEAPALRIEAVKRGFYPAHLTINFEVKPQKTEVYNATGTSKNLVVDVNNTLVTKFDLKTRWNNSISFRVNYTDVTNRAGPYNSLNSTEPINNATIFIPTLAGDDSPGQKFYYDNDGTDYWDYTCLGGGIYEIRLTNLGYFDLTVDRIIQLSFRIEKQNYSARDFDLKLTVLKRRLSFNFLNATVLRGYHLDPVKFPGTTWQTYLATMPIYQELNVTFELLDRDDNNARINLTRYLQAGQTLNDFLSFSTLRTSQVFQYEVGGKIRYNVSIYTGLDVGWYNLQAKASNIPNYRDATNATMKFEVLPVPTQFYNKTSLVDYVYVHPNQYVWDDNFPVFRFEVWDLRHSSLYGPTINDSVSQLVAGNLVLDWVNPNAVTYGGQSWWLTLEEFQWGNATVGSDEVQYLHCSYAIYVNITGVPASSTPYNIDLQVIKDNHESIHETLSFRILEADTTLYSVYLNQEYLANGDDVRFGPNDEIVVPWNQTLDLSFGWGYTDYQGRHWAIPDEAGAPVTLTVTNWFAGKTGSWTTQKGTQSYDYYEIRLYTDLAQTNVSTQFTCNASKANFKTGSITLTVRVRPRIMTLLIYDELPNSKNLDTSYTQQYGRTFSVGFELLDGEEDTDLVDPYPDAWNGLTADAILGVQPGQPVVVSQGDVVATGSLTYLETVDLGGVHHFYNLSIPTTGLDVRDDPYQITVDLEKDHFETVTVTFNLTVTQRVLQFEAFAQSASGPAIATVGTDESFEIIIQLIDPDTGDPIHSNDFVVTYQFYFWNTTTKSITAQTWVNASGTLEWDEEKSWYSVELPLLENMTGGAYRIVVSVTSVSGNYAPIETTIFLLVQNRGTVVPAEALLLLLVSILAVTTVVGFVVRKGLQMRIPFVLRMIDESIKKISEDKYPAVGVMKARREFIVESVVSRLDEVGIKWDVTERFSIEDLKAKDEEEVRGPMTEEELRTELEKIVSLTPEERTLFLDELKRLKRREQEEFLDSIREG
ncbi:MAG: hypothetical protein Kow0069_10880 [Promethearchaeota archaeon]